jgi:competence protein ComEC
MSPIFKKGLKILPERFGLREIISATIGVQVFVLPFILYKMGSLSIISPITNILILPFIPMTMFFGFISGVVAMVSGFLAMPFGWLAYILLKFEIRTVQIFSNFSFSTIKVAHFPLVLVLIFYIFIGIFLFSYYRKNNLKLDEK